MLALYWGILHRSCACLQVVKGLRGEVQDVALKMLIGETHYQVNSFRQVHSVPGPCCFPQCLIKLQPLLTGSFQTF